MKSQIETLHKIANKESRTIIGLMSGTSLDGLDIALCHVSGHGRRTALDVQQFTTVPYEESLVRDIKEIFAKEIISLQSLSLLNERIGTLHGELISRQLKQWEINPSDVDLIASHGQTVYHSPQTMHKLKGYPDATLQIGDGDHVARTAKIITISDFRQRHIAAGGEGAPLVVYGDSLLYSSTEENRILLNIGGIANFTYLPQLCLAEQPFCSDIGPGNTMMDAYVQQHFDMAYDHDGKIAASGNSNQTLLNTLMSHDFFSQTYPKTTGPEVFNLQYLNECLDAIGLGPLPEDDILATLNEFTTQVITECMNRIISNTPDISIYVSGGGLHNTFLMNSLVTKLAPVDIKSSSELGIDPDAKEAVLFAVLANECVAGDIDSTLAISGMPQTSMGKICFPT